MTGNHMLHQVWFDFFQPGAHVLCSGPMHDLVNQYICSSGKIGQRRKIGGVGGKHDSLVGRFEFQRIGVDQGRVDDLQGCDFDEVILEHQPFLKLHAIGHPAWVFLLFVGNPHVYVVGHGLVKLDHQVRSPGRAINLDFAFGGRHPNGVKSGPSSRQ